jgi:hypothetical protein
MLGTNIGKTHKEGPFSRSTWRGDLGGPDYLRTYADAAPAMRFMDMATYYNSLPNGFTMPQTIQNLSRMLNHKCDAAPYFPQHSLRNQRVAKTGSGQAPGKLRQRVVFAQDQPARVGDRRHGAARA